MEFEWDDVKAASNWRKHRISFDDAGLVFLDTMRVMTQDRIEDNEVRWQTVGMARGILLLIAHTLFETNESNELVRIISARRPNKAERHTYEHG